MKKRRLEKLVLNRETLRELSVEESRKVVGGDDGGCSVAEASCNDPGVTDRGRIPVG